MSTIGELWVNTCAPTLFRRDPGTAVDGAIRSLKAFWKSG